MPLLRISFIALFLTFPLSSYGNSDNRLALYWEGESLINCAAEAVRIGNKKEMDFYTSAAVQFNLALAMDENSANGHSQAAHDELEARHSNSRISTRTKSLIRKYDDEDVNERPTTVSDAFMGLFASVRHTMRHQKK